MMKKPKVRTFVFTNRKVGSFILKRFLKLSTGRYMISVQIWFDRKLWCVIWMLFIDD